MGIHGSGRPRTTTFRGTVLRTLARRLAFFGGAAGMLLLWQAIGLAPSEPSSDAALGRAVARPPSWTAADATAHPHCRSSAGWPIGQPVPYVVVHSFRDGVDRKVSFDAAWQANHNRTEADDVWVVGVCE